MLDVDYVLSWLDLDASEELEDDELQRDAVLTRSPYRWSEDGDE